jgi:uncharacterized protein (UPF0333 family)
MRAQLEEMLRPALRVQLTLDANTQNGARMSVVDGGLRAVSTLSGAKETVSRANSKTLVTVSQALKDSALVQTVDGNGVHQERSFTRVNASVVRLRVRITGGGLSQEVTASSTYARSTP